LNLVLHGLFEQARFIGLLRGYIAYAQTPKGWSSGSGKSMEMELLAHQVMTHPALGNPT
jgi:type I restriction enzyme, R subunit